MAVRSGSTLLTLLADVQKTWIPDRHLHWTKAYWYELERGLPERRWGADRFLVILADQPLEPMEETGRYMTSNFAECSTGETAWQGYPRISLFFIEFFRRFPKIILEVHALL